MNGYCAVCDGAYAARLLCLYESLGVQAEPFRLFVLCLDAETERLIGAFARPDLVAIPLAEVLAAEPAFAAVRTQRTRVEFVFTAKPVLVGHCLRREPAAETMTYLDGDLFFFGSPAAVRAVQGEASIALAPHRFPARLADRAIYGTYNAGWISFRRDADGLAGLAWWRERCLEWCFDRVEDGRFTDQRYLDELPGKFGGVRVLDHAGVNAAPWNVADARVESAGGEVRIDGVPLLFYHFQGLRETLPGWFDPGFRAYGAVAGAAVRDLIYGPYLRRLRAMEQRLRAEHGIGAKVRRAREDAGANGVERWKKFKQRTLAPYVRRWRGELIHGPEAKP